MPVGEASMMPSRGSKVLFGPVRSRRTGAHDRGVELHLPEEVLQHVVLVDVVLLVVAVGGGDPQRRDAERFREDPERQRAAQRG